MATHVTDGPVAKVIPAMPFMRVQIGVELAEWSGAKPGVPMQALRGRSGRRTRPNAAVCAIRTTVCFSDVTHHAGPNNLTQTTVAIFAMALVSHLSRCRGPGSHVTQHASLGNIMSQGLFAIHSLVKIHGALCRRSMMMIWC